MMKREPRQPSASADPAAMMAEQPMPQDLGGRMFTPRRLMFVGGILTAFVVAGVFFWAARTQLPSAAAEPIRRVVAGAKPDLTTAESIREAGPEGLQELDDSLVNAADYRTAEALFDTYIEVTRPDEEKTHNDGIIRFGFGSQFRRLKKLGAMIQDARGVGARAFAVSQMMGLGIRDMTETVCELLDDPKLDSLGRIALLDVLPCSSKPEALAAVEAQCADAEVGAVRAEAVRVLSRMESPRLAEVAEKMLAGDPSPLARTAAAEAMADCLRYFDAGAEKRVAFLMSHRTSEESSLCRAQLMRAAVHSGLTDPTLLGRVLAAKSVPANEKRAAARALAEMDSAAAVATMDKHLSAGLDPPTRRLVFNAIRRMTCPESRDALARWAAEPATRPAGP